MILNKIQFTNLRVLYWLIPLLILMLYLLKKKFVKDELRLIKTKKRKRILFVLRFIILVSLMFALSLLLCFL